MRFWSSGWKFQALLPPRLCIAKPLAGLGLVELFDLSNGFGETLRLIGFCLGNNLVFEFSQCDQKFAGFERLDDICIGPHLACFLGPERLQFPHRQ